MNGLVAPKPSAAALARWTRHAEFLVYLVPVGTISTELYDGYVRLLQAHSVLAIRSLTRPGGYAAELSPFRSFAWDGAGAIRFRFVSTTDKIDTFDGEDVHAGARAVGVLGICHCPTTPSLPVAYQQFMDSIRHFPGLLIQKCFAFEHQFDLRTSEECAALTHLVMFPVYHELDSSGGGRDKGGVVMSTVSLHLQVVLDTLCVTILMSLESTVRAAVRQQQTTQPHTPSAAIEMGDAAGFLLDTNVEPSTTTQLQQQHQMHHASTLSPFPSREALSSGASSPSAWSLPSTPTTDRPTSGAAATGGGGGVSSLFVSAETRNRRRHLARQRKLFGDYAVLLSAVPDALEHYVTAIELLRDEERKSGGAPGDTLWLAAALEGYVFCLYQQCHDKFSVEIVEKASEAVALYAKAGVSELEISLIEHMGLYYTAVAVQLSSQTGLDKIEEATWVKRLLWEVIERGVAVFPDLGIQRQVQFLVQSAGMLEAVGHHRRMALYLHEAVALLTQRWRPTNGMVITSPGSQTSHPQQRAQELNVARRLESITAQRLGMADRSTWEITSLRRRPRRLRRLQRQQHHKKAMRVTIPMAMHEVEPWLVLRFHVLRQLVSIAKMLADPFLVGCYCIQLLQLLSWCDEVAQLSPPTANDSNSTSAFALDQPQTPFSLFNTRGSLSAAGYRAGLHSRTSGGTGSNGPHFHGVYSTPPASIEVKSKRYFNMSNSPSATMSSAAATITSTIANTPRTLLATPRQQFSAAVNAISTKATPAFSSFSNTPMSGPSSSTPPSVGKSNRSSSANAAEMMNGSNSGGLMATPNGARSSSAAFDAEMAKAPSGLTQSEPAASWSFNAVDGVPTAVWDLRSRHEIQRLQRRVLSILEAECAVLRPTEQLKLDSFIQVDAIRILHDVNRNPVLKKEAALAKCGVSATASNDVTDVDTPAFFYNPFDKKTPPDAKVVAAKLRRNYSDSDDDDAAEHDETSSDFERCFPVHERVQIEVTLSNPYGIELDLQQVAVWIDTPSQSPDRVPSSTSSTSAVETYPSSVVLQPYERRKKIVLGVRGLRPGAFHVTGCSIKVLNIKTSFRRKTPLRLDIVAALPVLSLSLVEIGSLSEEAESSGAVDAVRDGMLDTDASAAVAITEPICMFANETKRCILHVRNTGQRAVHFLHVTVRAGNAARSLSIAQVRTLFTTVNNDAAASPLLAFETDGMVFKCLANSSTLASLLPLERGDHMAIPFEVSLRSAPHKRAMLNRQEQLQWTLLYGEDKDSTMSSSPRPIVYYRESQQIVTLVPLGSLAVHTVQVLPKSSIDFPSTRDTTDGDSCIVIVEVANPTETVFLVRIREGAPVVMESGVDCGSESHGGDDDWDIEIGRQSTRCLVVEVPRLENEQVAARSVAAVFNDCLELTWKTYFGTTGCLLFHDGLWTEREQELALLHLTRSDLSFRLNTDDGLVQSSKDIESSASLNTETHDPRGPPFPFRFYQSVQTGTRGHQPVERMAKLFQPCAVTIRVRHQLCAQKDLVTKGADRETAMGKFIEAEVFVKRESESYTEVVCMDEDAVMVAGQLQRILSTTDADAVVKNSSVEWQWRIVCVFLSEGCFEVAVNGRSLGFVDDVDEGASNHIWGCERLRIRCMP